MKFNFDNPFFRALGKVVDCIWLCILWLVCSLPVLTMGASSTALYYTVHKRIRGGRGYTTRAFFKAFKDNFKPATLSWLVVLVVWLVAVGDIVVTRQLLMKGSSLGMFFYFFIILLLFAAGWSCYVFSYIARFSNTVINTLKNALFLELRHLPWTLLVILILLAGVVIAWLIPGLIFLVPATVALMFDLILERIFRRYMSPEDLAREMENDKDEE